MSLKRSGIYDEAGRYLGPAHVEIQTRPMGPWNGNGAVRAVFAFIQPAWDGGPGIAMFHILGGASDKSTVSAETLRALGIAVPAHQVAA